MQGGGGGGWWQGSEGGGGLLLLFLFLLVLLLLLLLLHSFITRSRSAKTNKWEHLFNGVNLHINYPTELISTSPLLAQVPEELLQLLEHMLRSLSRH